MKIPKCPKTVSGKHKWKTKNWGVTEEINMVPIYGTFKITPNCEYCGLIDDRKTKTETQ